MVGTKRCGVLSRRSWIADVSHGLKSADGAHATSLHIVLWTACLKSVGNRQPLYLDVPNTAWAIFLPLNYLCKRYWAYLEIPINIFIELKPYRGPAFFQTFRGLTHEDLTRLQNRLPPPAKEDFWPKINILKGNHCEYSSLKIGHDLSKNNLTKMCY